MRSTSKYRVVGATQEQEVQLRKTMLGYLKADRNPNGTKPHAIAYGVINWDGQKCLFKHCPEFPTWASFEKYVRRHRQIVLAVYNH